MPSLSDILHPKKRAATLPAVAHHGEEQWVHPKLSWEDGVKVLQSLFPKDTREDRPAAWYRRLRATHWPRCVPPGNGPFFLPTWPFDAPLTDAQVSALKKAGFKLMQVPVRMLPNDAEYLASAMRAAADASWNVDPVLYKAYLYPTLPGAKRSLRKYTTSPWSL